MNITFEDCKIVWDKWKAYQETAEQYTFSTMLMIDMKLEPAWKDLKENWNEKHGELFIRMLNEKVFPMFGIS